MTADLSAMSGADLIAAERARQITEEGWTPEHDAHHASNEALARAATCYAMPARLRSNGWPFDASRIWPWTPTDWKPTPDDRVRELVKAGALIAAEIDRLAAASRSPEGGATGGDA